MTEENEYEIEEGDGIQYYIVTRVKDSKTFLVERVHHSVSDTTEDTIFDKNGEPVDGPREISVAVSKYLEKKEDTIEIDNNWLREELRLALGRELRGNELENFREYLSLDIPQWIADNAKTFARDMNIKIYEVRGR